MTASATNAANLATLPVNAALMVVKVDSMVVDSGEDLEAEEEVVDTVVAPASEVEEVVEVRLFKMLSRKIHQTCKCG